MRGGAPSRAPRLVPEAKLREDGGQVLPCFLARRGLRQHQTHLAMEAVWCQAGVCGGVVSVKSKEHCHRMSLTMQPDGAAHETNSQARAI